MSRADLAGVLTVAAKERYLNLLVNHSQVDRPHIASDALAAMRGRCLEPSAEADTQICSMWPVISDDDQRVLDGQLSQLAHGIFLHFLVPLLGKALIDEAMQQSALI